MTTTAIATIDHGGPGWVATLAPAAELAGQIANTEFVPTAMRGSVAKVTACIMFGDELGIGPMQSLAKIDVIDGRPAPKAELARALVLAAGHEMIVREMTTTKVTVAGRRRGSDEWQSVTWTMDDAKRAGLDGKQNWRKWPRQMLVARASADLARMAFPDVLGGVVLFSEELDGEVGESLPAAAGEVAEAVSRKRKVSSAEAKPRPQMQPAGTTAADLPPLPGEEDIIDAELVDDLITEPQMKKMLAILGTLDVKDRADRLALTASIIDAEITSAKELTRDQASKVIEALMSVEDGRAELRFDAAGAPFISTLDEVGE